MSRPRTLLRGGTIGLLVGTAWAAIVGPLTDGPPSVELSFAVYVPCLFFTGLAVASVQRQPVLVGLVAAASSLAAVSLVVGPKDGWIVMWVMVFGGSGLICGPLVGALFYMLGKPKCASLQTR